MVLYSSSIKELLQTKKNRLVNKERTHQRNLTYYSFAKMINYLKNKFQEKAWALYSEILVSHVLKGRWNDGGTLALEPEKPKL